MNLLRRLLPGIALITGTFLLSVGLQAFAWTAPPASPPTSSAYAPLNTGPTAQTKTSNLNANDFCIPSSGKCLSTVSGDGSGSGGASQWTTSGTNIYNNNTGNVGIGTTNPQVKLHIVTDTPNPLRVENSSGDIGIGLYQAGSWKGGIGYRPGVGLGFLSNSGLINLVVSDAGNVGIGTTNPNPQAKLDVAGPVRANALALQDGNNAGVVYFPNSGTLPNLYIRSGDPNNYNNSSTERLFISGTTGNVGIGTTNAVTKLTVGGQVRALGDGTNSVYVSNIGDTQKGWFGWEGGSSSLGMHRDDDGNYIRLEGGGQMHLGPGVYMDTTGYAYHNGSINTSDVWLRNANGGAGKWASQLGGLGAWQTMSVNTVYTAATDGFAVATVLPGGPADVYCSISMETPAGTIRQWGRPNHDGPQVTEMSPVRKGDTWQVGSYDTACSATAVYWMPLGN